MFFPPPAWNTPLFTPARHISKLVGGKEEKEAEEEAEDGQHETAQESHGEAEYATNKTRN